MKYINIIESSANYAAYKASQDFYRPNVTLCENDQSLKYKDATFDVTVTYKYQNMQTATPTFEGHYINGASYNIPSPVIEGYSASIPTVSGTINNSDLSFNVIYTQQGEIFDDEDEGL